MNTFEAVLAEIPQVIEAQRLFGEAGYFIRVVCTDLPAYQRLYDDVFSELPGLGGLNSTIVMKQSIVSRPLPLT